MSGWDTDRWDGAMVGMFFVGRDALPHGHTLLRQDDPDLVIFHRYESAVSALGTARMSLDRIADTLNRATDEDDLDFAVVQAMRALLNGADNLRRCMREVRNAKAQWAEVVQRLGFKDGYGQEVPIPGELAALLPPADDGE